MTPAEEYQSRLGHWREAHGRCELRYRQLGNARLLTGVAAAVLAALAFGAEWVSAWWLVLPLAVFIGLAIVHDRVDGARAAALRGVTCYERAIARLQSQWVGTGSQGERFRNPKHVYADDLDLFGRGSLFEMLSVCRTTAGEATLAGWLLAPGDQNTILARQQAAAELRPKVALREDLALIGEDIRAAVDDKGLAAWGNQPGAHLFPGARAIAFALACAAVTAIGLFFAQRVSLRPFLVVILVEIVFNFATRAAVSHIATGVSTPAQELRLLGLLLQRLEREPLTSPSLVALQASLRTQGRAASQEIRRLERLIEYLDSARLHQFFRPLSAPLLWISQFAFAIEAWRMVNGPHIGGWIAAVGEFEALCSLAAFAYERPDAMFPELVLEGGPMFEATGLRHPLIPAEVAIPNDVSLGGTTQLWIVSGSNMSGKSTLLRSIGLTAVLAWAGAPVTAGRMRVSPLFVGASMRANDSLTDHRSRFYAEIERLREIVDLTRAGHPTLFLLDELLSGTNSHDRRIGAGALVRGLVERGAIGLVTTHDLALADIAEELGGRASNVHFEDYIEGGQIRFDYRLRQGVVTRSNALELMRAVGLDV